MEINKDESIITFEKNSREVVKLSISEFRGKKLLDLRIWYYDKNEDDYKPSKKGLSISVDKYNELKDSVINMAEFLELDENKNEDA